MTLSSEPLHHLALEGKVIELVRGIKASQCLNSQRSIDGRSLLMTAAACGQPGCVQALLAMEADPHLLDHQNRTALSWAVEAADEDSIQALLQAGASVEVTGCGPTGTLSLRERALELKIPPILALIENAMRQQRAEHLLVAWPSTDHVDRERL